MPKVTHVLIALAATAVLAAGVTAWYASRETLPPEIRIAAGQQDGLYHKLAEGLAEHLRERTGRRVRVIETSGTEANVALVRDGGSELALIQTVAPTPEGLAGIAPLFPEPVHFIARKDRGIESLKDLEGKPVALGLRGSSMRQSSRTVLTHYAVKVEDTEQYFGVLETNRSVDAALVTTGWMNPKLEKLLQDPDLKLIAIDDADGLAMRHPWFAAITIPRGLYPGQPPVPSQPVRTVAVMALLVGRSDASDRLVRESLAALYETDLRSSFPAVLSAKTAKDYDAAVMHPTVMHYHDPAAQMNRLAQIFEFIAKSKEVLLLAVGAVLLLWGGVRRWRERAADAADQAQKRKLDDLIAHTLAVELEQMDVTDPEQLRPFLRRVTAIKQEALRELTREKVRGDQRFAIFLSQCAALSEKIQMRMMYGRMSETADLTAKGASLTA
ncbi:MAG: TAXI family TRAP transporter solute-binding subunit [Gemmataceae bacterium]|nr:TAXI family TRAP transporter solute-binding subunit [Gemmataceae bacterium]